MVMFHGYTLKNQRVIALQTNLELHGLTFDIHVLFMSG